MFSPISSKPKRLWKWREPGLGERRACSAPLDLFRRFQAAFGLVGIGFVARGFFAAHIVALPAFLHGVFFARLEALVEV